MVAGITSFGLIYLFCIAISILVAFILFIYPTDKRFFDRLLAAPYLALTLYFILIFFINAKLIIYSPHLLGIEEIFIFLYMPLSYLYLRSLITQKKPGIKDCLHLIPLLIYIIDYAPFFALTASEKLEQLNKGLAYSYSPSFFYEGWLFPKKFHLVLRVILQLSYWITEVSLFSAFLKGKTNLRRNENSTWIIWIRLYLVCQTLIFIPCVLMFFPVSLSYVLSLFPVFIAAAGILTAFSLFVHPEILYGMKIPAMPGIEIHHKPPVNTRIEKESGTGQKTMGKDPADLTRQRPLKNLTQKQIGYIKHELESLFETKQPFLQHGYILQDLSNTLSIPLHQLSALINHEYKMNFNDLINKYRVEYAIELYNSGRHENLNINGLATESGFNNRNSFTMAFKKFTGFTPSDYFRNQKKD